MIVQLWGYSPGDLRCLFWHRWIRRSWILSWASLGIGYGPAEECRLCGRGWGQAWAGDRIQ